MELADTYRVIRNGEEVEVALEDLTAEEIEAVAERLKKVGNDLHAFRLSGYGKWKFNPNRSNRGGAGL